MFEKIGELHPRPEILVYATDGCGPAPLAPPPGLHTIWLLVGRCRQRPMFPADPWGVFVEVDDHDTPAVDDAA